MLSARSLTRTLFSLSLARSLSYSIPDVYTYLLCTDILQWISFRLNLSILFVRFSLLCLLRVRKFRTMTVTFVCLFFYATTLFAFRIVMWPSF